MVEEGGRQQGLVGGKQRVMNNRRTNVVVKQHTTQSWLTSTHTTDNTHRDTDMHSTHAYHTAVTHPPLL